LPCQRENKRWIIPLLSTFGAFACPKWRVEIRPFSAFQGRREIQGHSFLGGKVVGGCPDPVKFQPVPVVRERKAEGNFSSRTRRPFCRLRQNEKCPSSSSGPGIFNRLLYRSSGCRLPSIPRQLQCWEFFRRLFIPLLFYFGGGMLQQHAFGNIEGRDPFILLIAMRNLVTSPSSVNMKDSLFFSLAG
jgi:hypothetical protein